MLTLFSNRFLTLAFISMSLCQVECIIDSEEDENREDCIMDNDAVLNENGTEVSVTVLNTNSGTDDGYYALKFSEGRFEGSGALKAWCVDLSRDIEFKEYHVDIFSSMQTDLFTTQYPDAVDKPNYIPSINWLINTYSSGTEVTFVDCDDNHVITDREFQLAVWSLVDDETDPASSFPGEAMECVIDNLVSEAMNFTDYKIDCTDIEEEIGLIVIVDDAANNITNQVMIMEVLLSNTNICNCPDDPGILGDPHFKTWAGEHYDFHGVCDLVMMKNPEFGNGLGMDIHMRTARMGSWSYISNAVIRIGEDTLEIVGGQVETNFWINGIAGDSSEISNTELQTTLTSTISGFPIHFKQPSSKQREFAINLGESEMIIFKTWNSFVSVQVKNAKHMDFKNSVGLLGSFPRGTKVARDNISVVDEVDAFGQEWQVLASEKNLFHNIAGPQHPARCEIPSHLEMRRRLGDSIVTSEQAEKACANVNADMMNLCVFDVMATNDVLAVGAY
jgi:hypothetical protein